MLNSGKELAVVLQSLEVSESTFGRLAVNYGSGALGAVSVPEPSYLSLLLPLALMLRRRC